MGNNAPNLNEVNLRRATINDSEVLFAWQTHSNTRQHFHTPQAPTQVEHDAWCHQIFNNSTIIFNIIEHQGIPAGMIRLDSTDNPNHYSVSILVSPNKQNQGIGSKALKLIRDLVPNSTLIAEVNPENIASQKMFEKSGYKFETGKYFHRPEI